MVFSAPYHHLFSRIRIQSIRRAIFYLPWSLSALSPAITRIDASCLYKLVANSSLLSLNCCFRRCAYKIITSISPDSFYVKAGTLCWLGRMFVLVFTNSIRSFDSRGIPVCGHVLQTEMQCRIVDFQKRWPVLAETIGWMRGLPEREHTRADIDSRQSIYYNCRSTPKEMQKQVQMVGIKKRDEKVMKLQPINSSIRQNVLRLLNRESYELELGESKINDRSQLYIDPHSTPIFIWNVLYLIIFYLIQLQISLSLAFGVTFFEEELRLTSFYRPIYFSFLAFLVLDIVLSFFKGYYSFGKGRVIDDSRKIIVNYLKSQFPYDLFTVLLYVIPLIHESQGLNFLQLITAGLIWIKKFKYQNEIQTFLQYRSNLRASFTLTILFIDVLMIGNYGACIFIGMDLYLYHESYYGTGQNSPYYWLTTNTAYPYSLIYGPWYYQYIYGQEFATGTLSTLAPGPFGKNPYEIFYSILVMIFFVVLSSYVAEVLIQIVYTNTQRRTFHEDNIISFDNFMQVKEVARSIRRRVYNFFQLIWEVQLKVETKEQEEMIDKLPLYLREQLLLQIGFTKYLYFLEKMPQENTLKKLISLSIRRTTVDSNTVFFRNRGESVVPRQLVFIKQGMAKFYLSKEEISSKAGKNIDIMPEIVLSLSNVQRLLGVFEFVTGQSYSICCKSIDLCLVQTLSWTDFMSILTELHLQEEFSQLQYRVLVERDLKLIQKRCVVCLQSHLESECPQLYPRQKLIDVLKVEAQCDCNKRQKKKRRGMSMKKVTSQQQQLSSTNLFSMVPGFDIGQLIADFYKLDQEKLEGIEEAHQYHQFCKGFNVHNYHWSLIF